MATHLALVKAEYAYEAQAQEELTLIEDSLYYLLEAEDEEWHKVKLKTSPSSDDPPQVGLVPANYLVPAVAIGAATAVYAYEAQTEDELTITEDEQLELMEEDGDWSLVSRPSQAQGGVGYVPTAYIETSGSGGPAGAVEEDETGDVEEDDETAPVVAVASARPLSTAGPAGAKDVKTWSVTDIDGKKKRKGTLGVGNGQLFFASESDKTGVQQYRLTEITAIKTEKGKRILLTCGAEELAFQVPGKEIETIVAKIEEGRSAPAAPSTPPPPPIIGGARGPLSGINAPEVYTPSPPDRTVTPILRPPSAPNAMARSTSSTGGRKVAFAPPAGKPAVALYDFEGEGEDELSVAEGERLLVLDDVTDDDWWKCRKEASGEEGVVPASYVELDEGAPSGNAAAAEAASSAAAAEQARRLRVQEEADAQEAQRLAEEQADDAARQKEADAAAKKAAAAREAESQRKGEADAAAKRKREAEVRAAQLREAERAMRSVHGISGASGPPPPKVAARPDSAQSVTRPQPGAPNPPKRPDSAPREGKSKPSGKVRTWRDKTGQFKVEAAFLGLANGKIRLHKLNGVIIDVPLTKMSNDDVIWLEGATGRSLRGDDDDVPLSKVQASQRGQAVPPSAAAAERARQQQKAARATSSGQPKKKVDWFEFFLNAGCDIDDCTRYARNFDGDRIDESILAELEPATMRNLGLREGDVIRVRKYIKQKYSAPSSADAAKADQMKRDEELARKLQAEDQHTPIFTSGPNGALKSTRRGRPTPNRANTGGVDAASLATARDTLVSTSPAPPEAPLPVSKDPKRSSSTVPLAGGFDDDAWTVRPTSKPNTPKPPLDPVAAPNPAPAPAPTPPAAPAPPPAPQPEIRAASAAPTTSLSDQIMEKIMAAGQQQNRAPSAPGLMPPVPTGGSFSSQQGVAPQQAPYNGPRGPLAPVAANAPMLNPLIPTQTGMSGFVPTTRTGIRPQQTGFVGSSLGMQPQPTGFLPPGGMMGMQPQPTGYQPPTSAMGGMSLAPPQQQMSMPMQPTGMNPNMGMMQPQPTGFMPGQSFNGGASMGPPGPSVSTMSAMFAPPPSAPAGGPSTPAKSFDPGNVFAQMKTGAYGAGQGLAGPQDAAKYDALRPQPTGMPMNPTGVQGFGQPPSFGPQNTFGQQMMPGQPQQQPLQPQPTGFAPGGYISQPQPPMGMQTMYPQQTGWRGY